MKIGDLWRGPHRKLATVYAGANYVDVNAHPFVPANLRPGEARALAELLLAAAKEAERMEKERLSHG